MSLFDWLLVGHLVGDFLLQTDNMASFKAQNWYWMLRHTVVYVSVMAVIVGVYTLDHAVSLWVPGIALLAIGGTHVILDRRDFTQWWMRMIGISPDRQWLSIVADQAFHLVILAAVAQFMVLFGG